MGIFLDGSNGDAVIASTTPRAGAVVIADSNGTVSSWIPQWQYIFANSSLTTSSTSDVTIADMVVVPKAGTYEVEFYANVGNSANANTVVSSFYIGAMLYAQSTRSVITGGNNRTTQLLAATLTFDGTQQLSVRWSVNAGTATVQARTLRLKPVGQG